VTDRVLQVDTYDIRAVDILEPTVLVIGHDCMDAGAGWFLKKVVVMCGNKQELDYQEIPRYVFPCHRWLAYLLFACIIEFTV